MNIIKNHITEIALDDYQTSNPNYIILDNFINKEDEYSKQFDRIMNGYINKYISDNIK